MTRMDKRTVRTPQGTIAYLDSGPAGAPAVLFVHGIPTSSVLWRKVMPRIADERRCLAPDLMGLGDTEVDPERSDLSMRAQAHMLEDFLDAVGVGGPVAVVAHDQGGAAAQILVTTRPSRVERLVLADVVCFDNWPVPAIRRLQTLARLPLVPELLARSGAAELLETHTPWSAFRRGVLRPSSLPAEMIAEYLRPLRESAAARRRFRRFVLAGGSRHDGGGRARRDLPDPDDVGRGGPLPPAVWGRRLYETIPGARLEVMPTRPLLARGAPGALRRALAAFLGEPAVAPRPRPGQPTPEGRRRCPVAPIGVRRAKGR